jgi:putative DNA primase/helicase
MTASEEWFQIGTAAALKLSGSESAVQTVGTELLCDIKEIFAEKRVERISTADLIRALCTDDEKLWATYNRGLPIKPRQLASKLKGYGILSKTIRIGCETAKGYELSQFQESFLRYLPSPPSPSVTTSQMATSADLAVTDNPSRYFSVTDKKVCKPASSADCDVVTDTDPLTATMKSDDRTPFFDLGEVAI